MFVRFLFYSFSFLLVLGCSPKSSPLDPRGPSPFLTFLPFLILVILHYLYYKKIIPALHSLFKVINIILGFILGLLLAIVFFEYFKFEVGTTSTLIFLILNFIFATPFYFIARLYGRIQELEQKIDNIEH